MFWTDVAPPRPLLFLLRTACSLSSLLTDPSVFRSFRDPAGGGEPLRCTLDIPRWHPPGFSLPDVREEGRRGKAKLCRCCLSLRRCLETQRKGFDNIVKLLPPSAPSTLIIFWYATINKKGIERQLQAEV